MKISFVALFSFLAFFLIKAQTQPTPSLLWKVSGKGLEKPSYLFGTFHLMCKEDFTISEKLKSAFTETSQLYEELKMDDAAIQIKLMELMKSDKGLETLMSADDYKILSDSFQKITKFPIGFFNNYKPFLLASMLAQKTISCDKTTQPEMEFVALAKENKMEIFGLESVEEQLKAFDKISIDSQVNSILKMVKDFDNSKKMMQQLAAAYKKRDPNLLTKFMRENGADGDFEASLLTVRNNNWIPIIIKTMEQKPTFFAFGAGHLGSENGVIELLKKQGYILEPIEY